MVFIIPSSTTTHFASPAINWATITHTTAPTSTSASTLPSPSYLLPSADAHVLALIFLISCLIVTCGYVAYKVRSHGGESLERALQVQKITWERTLNRRARRALMAHMRKMQKQVANSQILAHHNKQPLVTKIRDMTQSQTQLQESFDALKKAQDELLQSLSDHKQQSNNEREADRFAISKANTKVQDFTKILHKLKDDHDNLRKTHKATDSKLNTKAGQLHELHQALETTNSSLETKTGELRELRNSLNATKSSLDTKTGELHNLQEALKATKNSLNTNASELQKLQKVYQAAENKLDNKAKELHDLQKALESTDNNLSAKADEICKMHKEHEITVGALKEARTDIEALHATSKSHSDEKTTMQRHINELKASVSAVVSGKANLQSGLHELQQAHDVTSGALNQSTTGLIGLQTSMQTDSDEKAAMKQQIEHLQTSMRAVIDEKAKVQKQLDEVDFCTLKQAIAANDLKLSKLDYAVAELTQSTLANGNLTGSPAHAGPQVDDRKNSTASISNAASSGAPTSELVACSQTHPPALQNSLVANIRESDKRDKHSPGHKKRRRRKNGHNKCNQTLIQADDYEDSDSETEFGQKLGSKTQSLPASSGITEPVLKPTQADDLQQSAGNNLECESQSTPEYSNITAPVSNPNFASDIQQSPENKTGPESKSTSAPSIVAEDISKPTQADDPAGPGYTTRDSVKASRHAPSSASTAGNAISTNALAASKFARAPTSGRGAANAATFTNPLAASKFASPPTFGRGTNNTVAFTNALAASKFADFGTHQYTDGIQGPYDPLSSQPSYKAPDNTTTCNMGHHHVPNRDFCYNYNSRQYYSPGEPCDVKPTASDNNPKPPLSTTHPLAHLNPPTAPKSMLSLENQQGEDTGSMAVSKYAPKLVKKEPENFNKFRGHGPDGYKARRKNERAERFGTNTSQNVPGPTSATVAPMDSINGGHQSGEKAAKGSASVYASKFAH